jgi:hypothetical protein
MRLLVHWCRGATWASLWRDFVLSQLCRWCLLRTRDVSATHGLQCGEERPLQRMSEGARERAHGGPWYLRLLRGPR